MFAKCYKLMETVYTNKKLFITPVPSTYADAPVFLIFSRRILHMNAWALLWLNAGAFDWIINSSLM